MQTVSRDIRNFRAQRSSISEAGCRRNFSPDIREAFRAVFAARQDLAAKLAAQIVAEGSAELHGDSTALCSHFKLRRGEVGGEPAEAQVYTHEVGIVIRFWVYGPNFEVRARDLILLALPAGEKGYEVWLDDGNKIFPHEGGKYSQAGQAILSNMMSGR